MPATLTRFLRETTGPKNYKRDSRRRKSNGPTAQLTPHGQALAESAVRLAYRMASDWARRHRGLPMDELKSEALYALTYAASRYDASTGVPFASYTTLVVRHRLLQFTRWYLARRATPLDRESKWGDDDTTEIATVDPGADAADSAHAHMEVERLRTSLDSQHFYILWEHFAEGRALEDIGNDYCVSRQRIRQIEAEAVRAARLLLNTQETYA
jgi:RNA polymerase sigma factor (sigma-70 family)